MIAAVFRFVLRDHADQCPVKDRIDACRYRWYKIDQRLVKMMTEMQLFKINLCDKTGNIEPHRKVAQHRRSRNDDDIQKQIILLLYEQKHQGNAYKFARRVLCDSILKLLHPGKKPGNVKHR